MYYMMCIAMLGGRWVAEEDIESIGGAELKGYHMKIWCCEEDGRMIIV